MNRDKWFKESFHFCDIGLSTNEESIKFLLENLDLIENCNYHTNEIGKIKYTFSLNPYATSFFIKNKDKIDWKAFSRNNHPDALEFLKKHKKKVSIENLALNESKEAMKFLEYLLIKNKKVVFKKLDNFNIYKKQKE